MILQHPARGYQRQAIKPEGPGPAGDARDRSLGCRLMAALLCDWVIIGEMMNQNPYLPPQPETETKGDQFTGSQPLANGGRSSWTHKLAVVIVCWFVVGGSVPVFAPQGLAAVTFAFAIWAIWFLWPMRKL
jgi:hypothetical protein